MYADLVLQASAPTTPRRAWHVALLAAVACYLLYAVARFLALSLHWPLVGDATLLHYCVFLMRHGFAPYRELADPNLPGTYFVEWCVTQLFGYGALPWRVFDLLLLASLAATAPAILRSLAPASTRTEHAFGALWAAGIFALIHGRDGMTQLGQRDLLMTALLSAGCAALLRGHRVGSGSYAHELPYDRSSGFAAAGFCIGCAATVKPLAILLLPAWLLCFATRRATRLTRTATAAGCMAACLPLAAVGLWLLQEHALTAFFDTMQHLVPLHSSLFRLRPAKLLGGTVSSVLLPLFLLALPPLFAAKPWRTAAGRVVLCGFAFGALSFWLQGRGYPYHRYPSEWFLLLLWGAVLPVGLRGSPVWLRACAVCALGWSVLVIAPRSLTVVQHITPQVDPQGAAMQAALQQLGGLQLNGRVQCIDMAGGCVTALLRAQLVQSTGFLYDCYAMAPVGAAFAEEQRRYRAAWMQALTAHPPDVMIAFSDECGPRDDSFRILAQWPKFAHLLTSRYTLRTQWNSTQTQRWGSEPELPYTFRIYTRAGSPQR